MASRFSAFVLVSCLVIASSHVHVSSSAHLVKGLSWSFYKNSCPKVESIIRKHLEKVFEEDIGQAAGLLRLHFHDCFVQGCDGSVLLDGSASEASEQDAAPNQTLRRTAFKIIDDLRKLLDKKCSRVVSCADIVALAARDSVFLSGGPEYDVPLGRRDGLTPATVNVVLENLPAPTENASEILAALAKKHLDATDVVALSGGHTIGRAHCAAFQGRLYPTQDPTMEEAFANDLKGVCPTTNSTNTTVLDIRSPNLFDNKYFVNLVNREGLFTSDQDLYEDPTTRDIVTSFAKDRELFFEKFILAMTKMGQLELLTGTKGEIRANCSVTNSENPDLLASVVEEDLESYAELK
ncbi:peroxidase 12 [Rhodamnia argentea]|uniref:Peroxidase n=1 Tax=Rhodamnia argentea TaxID=178133 RepID=A0A8B8QAI7_9MYRT|nr:peroxidase 12 [Rhodamnia argentea]